jgi:hypothetical protein
MWQILINATYVAFLPRPSLGLTYRPWECLAQELGQGRWSTVMGAPQAGYFAFPSTSEHQPSPIHRKEPGGSSPSLSQGRKECSSWSMLIKNEPLDLEIWFSWSKRLRLWFSLPYHLPFPLDSFYFQPPGLETTKSGFPLLFYTMACSHPPAFPDHSDHCLLHVSLSLSLSLCK